jgi:hypothetical protein
MADVTIKAPKSAAWTLGRIKGIAAFLGGLIGVAVTVIPLPGPQAYWTGAVALLTFISVYGLPNLTVEPRRALLDDQGDPVISEVSDV